MSVTIIPVVASVTSSCCRPKAWLIGFGVAASALTVFVGTLVTKEKPLSANPVAAAATYHNYLEPEIPWSIHVVRAPRRHPQFELQSVHAHQKAVGLATVTDQTELFDSSVGRPLAAINGDFYQRAGAYGGDPRGLQIVLGDLISAPSGMPSFWIDVLGEPHAGETRSMHQVIWPDGSRASFGLNGYREANALVLYTPALGPSTQTTGGRELILVPASHPWLPLRPGRIYRARVRQIHDGGNAPIAPGTMVLSLGPEVARRTNLRLTVGAEILVSTATEPSLRGVKTAISGGPVLVRHGKRQRIKTSDSESYEFSSMKERHPRSAIGWNENYYFLVQVDGRQKGLSVGMTLDELAAYLVKLGCRDAINLDGGGSATLWFEGKVRNRPCDGYEREVANSLVVLQKNHLPPGGTQKVE